MLVYKSAYLVDTKGVYLVLDAVCLPHAWGVRHTLSLLLSDAAWENWAYVNKIPFSYYDAYLLYC